MVRVQDLRENGIRQEAIAPTEAIEDIVKSQQHHKTWTKIKRVAGNVYYSVETAGAGFLAGYVVSGGDMDTATQFAEYAIVLLVGAKVGIELPLKIVMRKIHRSIEEKVNEEARYTEQLETKEQLHIYKPEQGVDFTNHDPNFDNPLGDNVQSEYWSSIEGARKLIGRTWFKDEWFYSLVDIVQALTDSVNPTDYLKKLRKRDSELGSYLGTNCPHVEMLTETGKKRKTLAGKSQIIAVSCPERSENAMWLR